MYICRVFGINSCPIRVTSWDFFSCGESWNPPVIWILRIRSETKQLFWFLVSAHRMKFMNDKTWDSLVSQIFMCPFLHVNWLDPMFVSQKAHPTRVSRPKVCALSSCVWSLSGIPDRSNFNITGKTHRMMV